MNGAKQSRTSSVYVPLRGGRTRFASNSVPLVECFIERIGET